MASKTKIFAGIIACMLINASADAVTVTEIKTDLQIIKRSQSIPRITLGMSILQNIPTFTEILTEPISRTWIAKLNRQLTISYEPYEGVEFTDVQKEQLRNITYRTIYVACRLDALFSDPLPWTDGRPYLEWLEQTINRIVYSSDPDIIQYYNERSIYLNANQALSNFANGDLTSWNADGGSLGFYNFISIINHEARHGDEVMHTDCNGRSNMDESLQNLGSHGVNALFLHWMRWKLPPEMVDQAIAEYGEGFLNPSAYVWRMCTFDEGSWLLDPADSNWVFSISGHFLPPVSF